MTRMTRISKSAQSASSAIQTLSSGISSPMATILRMNPYQKLASNRLSFSQDSLGYFLIFISANVYFLEDLAGTFFGEGGLDLGGICTFGAPPSSILRFPFGGRSLRVFCLFDITYLL